MGRRRGLRREREGGKEAREQARIQGEEKLQGQIEREGQRERAREVNKQFHVAKNLSWLFFGVESFPSQGGFLFFVLSRYSFFFYFLWILGIGYWVLGTVHMGKGI